MPVPLADLSSAVLYGLQRELLRLPLEDAPERHAALIVWLQTLASLFPGDRNREALRRLVRQVASAPRLDTRTWRRLLLDSEGPLLPQGAAAGGIAWSACRGWSEEARGCAPPRLERTRSRACGVDSASAVLRQIPVGYGFSFTHCLHKQTTSKPARRCAPYASTSATFSGVTHAERISSRSPRR